MRVSGNGGCPDNRQIVRRKGEEIDVVIVKNADPFALKSVCEVRWCAVVTGNGVSFVPEIARQGTHANAADAKEKYLFICVSHIQIHESTR